MAGPIVVLKRYVNNHCHSADPRSPGERTMPKMHRKLKHAVVVLSALPFAISLALAETPAAKKGVSEAEVKYRAAGSPRANEPMQQNVDPNAPAMKEV